MDGSLVCVGGCMDGYVAGWNCLPFLSSVV